MSAEKHDFFPNTIGFFVFLNGKYLKSAPAAEGGRGATKFSAEMMVNRATWQIVDVFVFRIRKTRISVAPRRFFSIASI